MPLSECWPTSTKQIDADHVTVLGDVLAGAGAGARVRRSRAGLDEYIADVFEPPPDVLDLAKKIRPAPGSKDRITDVDLELKDRSPRSRAA
jgi:hypothetical protein